MRCLRAGHGKLGTKNKYQSLPSSWSKRKIFSLSERKVFSNACVPLKESKITLSKFTVETVLWKYHDVMLCEISFSISIELYERCLQSKKELWKRRKNIFTLRFASSVVSISKGQAGINFGHEKVLTKYRKQSKVFHKKWGLGNWQK